MFRRGDFLAALFSRHKIIAVVGSHGKTSVSGRLAWAFHRIGFDTSYLVGGQFKNFTLPCGFYSKSKWVVMEVDESDGSIDQFSPWMTVCLNCDWDHVDQYADSLSFADTLKSLFERTQEAVVYSDSPSLITLVSRQKDKNTHSFESAKKPAHFLDANNRAVLAVGKALGLNLSEIDFEKFPGMERRQSLLLILLVELFLRTMPTIQVKSASLLALRRKLLPEHQMRVVFQPHRYSRTKVFAAQFAEELSQLTNFICFPHTVLLKPLIHPVRPSLCQDICHLDFEIQL